MAEPTFMLTQVLTQGYRHLLWQTFFAERQRGFSLEDHFLRLAQPDEAIRYGVLEVGHETIAGMTVRKLPPAAGSTQPPQAAALGMVCVACPHRGQGLATQLLKQSMAALATQGINAFTLWTGKPTVYQSLGFVPADLGLLAWVKGLPNLAGDESVAWARCWPDAQERDLQRRGLPPFALGAQRVSTPDRGASAVLLSDPRGFAVAEWSGPTGAVVDLLAGLMPPAWRLHAIAGDELPTELARRGAQVEQEPTSSQMWCAPGPPLDWTTRYPLRLLDRI